MKLSNLLLEWTTAIIEINTNQIKDYLQKEPDLLWTPIPHTLDDFADLQSTLDPRLGTSFQPVCAIQFLCLTFHCFEANNMECYNLLNFLIDQSSLDDLDTRTWGDCNNSTLQLVCFLENQSIARLLLEKGVSTTISNDLGYSPKDSGFLTRQKVTRVKTVRPNYSTPDRFKLLKELAEESTTGADQKAQGLKNEGRYFRKGLVKESQQKVLKDDQQKNSKRQQEVDQLAKRSAVKNNPLFQQFEKNNLIVTPKKYVKPKVEEQQKSIRSTEKQQPKAIDQPKARNIEQQRAIEPKTIEQPKIILEPKIIEQPKFIPEPRIMEQPKDIPEAEIVEQLKVREPIVVEQFKPVERKIIEQPKPIDYKIIEQPKPAERKIIEQPRTIEHKVVEQPKIFSLVQSLRQEQPEQQREESVDEYEEEDTDSDQEFETFLYQQDEGTESFYQIKQADPEESEKRKSRMRNSIILLSNPTPTEKRTTITQLDDPHAILEESSEEEQEESYTPVQIATRLVSPIYHTGKLQVTDEKPVRPQRSELRDDKRQSGSQKASWTMSMSSWAAILDREFNLSEIDHENKLQEHQRQALEEASSSTKLELTDQEMQAMMSVNGLDNADKYADKPSETYKPLASYDVDAHVENKPRNYIDNRVNGQSETSYHDNSHKSHHDNSDRRSEISNSHKIHRDNSDKRSEKNRFHNSDESYSERKSHRDTVDDYLEKKPPSLYDKHLEKKSFETTSDSSSDTTSLDKKPKSYSETVMSLATTLKFNEFDTPIIPEPQYLAQKPSKSANSVPQLDEIPKITSSRSIRRKPITSSLSEPNIQQKKAPAEHRSATLSPAATRPKRNQGYGKLYLHVNGIQDILLPLPKDRAYVRCVVSDGRFEYMSRYEILDQNMNFDYECMIDTHPDMIITVSLHVRPDYIIKSRTPFSRFFSKKKKKDSLSGYVNKEDGAIGQARFALTHMLPACTKVVYPAGFHCFNAWYSKSFKERHRHKKVTGTDRDVLKVVGNFDVEMLFLPVTKDKHQTYPRNLKEYKDLMKQYQYTMEDSSDNYTTSY